MTLAEIQKYTKEFSILYAEDEESVRTAMAEVLGFFFNKIDIATNGAEGLELFHKNKYDIIVTDIQMPKMSGLEMIASIREINPDIPIIVTTAFNEQEYFLKSIELRVDKFLLKPVVQEQAKDTFYRISKMLSDNNKAKELEQLHIQEKINNKSKHIASQILDTYQNPCVIIQGTITKHVNKAFCNLFDEEDCQTMLSDDLIKKLLFDERVGFMRSLESYDEVDISKNIISVSKKIGRKIYKIDKKDIDLDDGIKTDIYLFHDRTIEEYQKVKIENYNSMLKDFIFKKHYSSIVHPVAEDKEVHVAVPNKKPEASKGEVKTRKIDKEQQDVLRRTRSHKTTASQYAQELDNETLNELQELDELDNEFKEQIELFLEEGNFASIAIIAQKLQKYAHEISLLFEFADLAYAIRALSTLLREVKNEKITKIGTKKVAVYLQGIQSDLADWRNFIFVDQSALDIHYLDSSLFSVCLQIEMLFSDEVTQIDTDDEDLIFF